MPLPDFHVSEPFTLGIELEMQVVNPPGYDLSQDSSMLIDAVKNKITAGEVKHDITNAAKLWLSHPAGDRFWSACPCWLRQWR